MNYIQAYIKTTFSSYKINNVFLIISIFLVTQFTNGQVDSLLLSKLVFGVQAEVDQGTKNLIESLKYAKTPDDSAYIYCQLAWFTTFYESETVNSNAVKAYSFLDRISNPRLCADLIAARGKGFWVMGDPVTGMEYKKKALEISKKNEYVDQIAWGYHDMALISIDMKDSKSAIDYVLESKKYFLKAGLYNFVLSESNRVIVNLIPGNRKSLSDTLIAELHSVLDTAKNIRLVILAHVNLMELYDRIGNQKLSMEHAFKALTVEEFNKMDLDKYSLYMHIARYFGFQQGNYAVASDYFDRLLEHILKNRYNEGVAEILIEKGKIEHLRKNDSLGMIYYNTALTISEKCKFKKLISSTYENIGNIYFDNSQFEKALSCYKKSLVAGCNLCSGIEFHSVLIGIGKSYLSMNRPDSAKYYFNQSLDLALSVNALSQIAESHMQLSSVYEFYNEIDQSINQLTVALKNTDECNALNLKKDIYHKLAEIYRRSGRFEQAFKYYDISQSFTDSINLLKNTEYLAQLETRFDFEKNKAQYELEQTLADREIIKQTQLKRYFVVGFILMTLLGIILFLQFRRKRRDNLLLIKQRKQIEELTKEMIAANEMKLDFFTNISHEFRTPLTIINGIVDEIKEEKNIKIDSKKIETLGKNTTRMLSMIDQLLDIRKLDKGATVFNLINGNISNYIKGIIATFEGLAKKKSIELVFRNLAGSEIYGYFDAEIYEKIVTNLVSNAVKFTENGGKIKVTVDYDSNKKERILILVEDTGIGIPKEKIQQIFEPFYRVSNYSKGSGIGLTLVKELAESMNGEVIVESLLNKGSKFLVKLPVEKELLEKIKYQEINENGSSQLISEQQPVSWQENIENTSDDEKSLNEKSILIVEDNEELLTFLSDNLKDDFKIYKAYNGEVGYERAREIVPDLIITDIMMPIMDGIQLCRKIKNFEYTNHIPVIILTAKAEDNDKLKGFEVGADDYIIKPFNTKLLKSRIKNILNEREKLIGKFSKNFKLEPQQIILPDRDKVFLERAIRCIENDITNTELSVENLASSMACSKIQLYRKLKTLTGMSPNHFIRDIRLKRAGQLIKSNNSYTISEIMFETGFSNYSYFVNCFKERFGQTPKEFATK